MNLVKIKVIAGDRVQGWTDEKSELPQEEGVLSDKMDTRVVTLRWPTTPPQLRLLQMRELTFSFKNGSVPSLCRFCHLFWGPKKKSTSVARVQSKWNIGRGSGMLRLMRLLRGWFFYSEITSHGPSGLSPVQPGAKVGSSFLLLQCQLVKVGSSFSEHLGA